MDQQWLTLIIVVLIAVILFDGVRRVRKARRDSIKMSLKSVPPLNDNEDEDPLGSEFPNGGARVSSHQIDARRIRRVRNRFDFGSDIADTMREKSEQAHQKWQADENKQANTAATEAHTDKVEPRMRGVDPLLDTVLHPSEAVVREMNEEMLREQQEYKQRERESTYQQASSEYSLHETNIQETSTKEANVNQLGTSRVPDRQRQPAPMTEDDVAVIERPQPVQQVQSTYQFDADDRSERIEPVLRNEQQFAEKEAKKPAAIENENVGSTSDNPDLVLVMHIKASDGTVFNGSDLLDVILSNGLRYGDMNIFHYHSDEEGEGPVLFSMANMVKPGTFDLREFENLRTVGLTFFLSLPVVDDRNMDAFDVMLSVVQNMADQLKADLKDEYRSVLTVQTIAHYRERIKDYSLRQQLKKKKASYR